MPPTSFSPAATLDGFPPRKAGKGALPLDDKERTWAIQVGRRLRAEFSTMVEVIPPHQRTAAELERVLNIHRAVTHRLMSAIAATDELETLVRIPGVQGLRNCASAARRKFGRQTAPVFAGVDSAIREFDELIRGLAGSHAKLIARIQASRGVAAGNGKTPIPPGRREDVRRTMYQLIHTLSGRQVAARCSISIIRPSPDSPDEFEYVNVRAYIGYRASSGGLPLVLASWVTDESSGERVAINYRDLDGGSIEGHSHSGLIEEFCTMPLPIVALRDTTGKLIQVIDQSRADPNAVMDAVTAYRIPRVGPLPSREAPPIYLEAINISSSTERLTADLYVHRSLMNGCTPSLGLYLGRGTGNCDLTDRWYEQIDGSPVLGLLGSGIGKAHTTAWDRHAELTAHVFNRLGWDAADYVGHRCEEHWPLWNCDYVMALDYRR